MKKQVNRVVKLLLLFVLAVILASACGGSAPHTERVQSPTGPTSAVRVVKHFMGETQIPANPQRVVTIHTLHLANALALGVKPVGSIGWDSIVTSMELEPYLNNLPGEFTLLGKYHPLNIETILRLKPDVIVGSDAYKAVYGQLTQIAPTVLFGWEGEPPWKNGVRETGEVLNRDEAVEQLFDRYNQRTQALKQKIKEKFGHLSVSVVGLHASSMRLALKSSFPGSILSDIGVSRPPSQNKEGSYEHPPVSLELIPQMDADVIFIVTGKDRESLDVVKQFKQHPLWSTLEAVKQNKVYQVNSEYWYGDNIIAANLVLDDLSHFLLEEK